MLHAKIRGALHCFTQAYAQKGLKVSVYLAPLFQQLLHIANTIMCIEALKQSR